jgi:transcription antitermination factor NusA-like protein
MGAMVRLVAHRAVDDAGMNVEIARRLVRWNSGMRLILSRYSSH